MWYKKIMLLSALFALCWALSAQELSRDTLPAEKPLEKSLVLLDDTISLIQSIESDNEALKAALDNVSDMLKTQGQLLCEQAKTQAEQSAISARQSVLLGKELRKGKVLKWSLIISAPVCIGLGIWAGWKLSK